MKNWLEYVKNSRVRQTDGSVSFLARACKWLNADRICMVIETLLGSSTGFSVQILTKPGEYKIHLDEKYSDHTVGSLNDFISKKLWSYDESRQVPDEKFEKAFAKQEKAKPDGTGYTADLAYNGLWVGLVRVSGEIDERDFLIVSVLGRSVLEAALGALHRSYRAVKAMPTVTEMAMPSKLSLENTNFRSPYASAYAIKRDNAWIGAASMIQQLNDLIAREGSSFGDTYTRQLQERGSNGPVWYRSVEAAKFFMELNVEPVAPKSEQPKPEAKEPAAKTWRAGEWLEYCSYGKLDGLPGQEKFEINFATIPLRELDLTTVKMVVGAFHIDRLGNNGGPGVSVEKLNDVEFNGKTFRTVYRLTVPYDVFQALYCTANPVFGLNKFIAETFRSKAEPAEAKKPEAKRAVWGAGSGSLFEDAG